MADVLGHGRGPARAEVQVIWTEPAIADLIGIERYVHQFNHIAARELAQRQISAAERLTTFPHRGRPVRAHIRELTTVWPFIIRYRVDGDVIAIIRVRHGMRRPPRP